MTVNPIQNPTVTSIRDLSREAFVQEYACDRLTATVLASRFRYIVQHMSSGLLTTAFSIILRDWYDFAATLSGPRQLDYPMPAVSNSLLLFSGTMAEAVRNSVEEFGLEELRAGDVLICNDPYRIGTHVNDVCFIRPIFHETAEPIGFINLQAHMLDMGGLVPGGHSGTKRNVFENGLVLSPRLLYHDDEPVTQTWNLIFDNARFGELLRPDIISINQNLLLGERLLRESIARYGIDAYFGAIRYACDISAESMRGALSELPDGVYEGEELIDCDGLDDAEEYRIKATVTIRGGRAEVDLGGTSRQARTSINAGWLDAKTAVGVALKFLLDPHTDFTSGGFRDIDLVLPEGTVVSALPPDGAIYLYWEASSALLLAIFRALEPALGRDAVGGDVCSANIHNANGVWPDGRPWIAISQCGGEHGPWGATKVGDADSYQVFYLANNLDPATEAIESDAPVVVLRKEYITDTAGPGENRGGAALGRDSLWLSESNHHSMPLHFKRPSGFGVAGGGDGTTGGVWVWDPDAFDIEREQHIPGIEPELYARATPIAGVLDPVTKIPSRDGEFFYFARVPVWETKPNTIFRYVTNGGGGWGDPLERDPERVKQDVRDEYVSPEGARRDYGVVIDGDVVRDPESLSIDRVATEQLRSEMRRLRNG